MAFSAGAPPFASAGKNFWIVIALFQKDHHLGRGGGPGQKRQPLVLAGRDQPVGRAGRDAERRPRRLGRLHIGGRQQRARADDPARHLGHRADHVERRRGAQRHLQRGKPARHQRLGQRAAMGRILDHQHRDDRGEAADLGGGAALLGGGHGQAPSWGGGGMGGVRQPEPPPRWQGPHAGGRPRTARARSRTRWRTDRRPPASRVSKSAASTVSVPATASSRTMSPSRSCASGPPIAASGQTWIAAGTLPEAPDIRPSVTSATLQPAVLQDRQRRRQRMQLRHPVRAAAPGSGRRRSVSEVNSPALKARLHRVLVVEDARRRLDHMPLGGDGRDLDDPAPEVARQLLQPARAAGTGRRPGAGSCRSAWSRRRRARSACRRSASVPAGRASSPSPAMVLASACRRPASSSCPIM